MKYGLLFVLTLTSLAMVGCGSGSEDDKLGTQAPPPSAGAVAVPLRTDKNRPGSNRPSGGGAPTAMQGGQLRAKPAGQ